MRMYRSTSTSRDGGGASAADLELLRREFKFIRDEDEDAACGETDWRVRMSVRYYRKLFREYALADLSRYQEGKLGLRWRTEMEVVAGKGQFSCGNKRCDASDGLHSYEVLFAYVERGEKKRCLVKLRVCPDCARKLFFKKLQQKEEEGKHRRKRRRRENKARRSKRQKRRASASEDSDSAASNSESDESEKDIHRLCAAINEQETRQHKEQRSAGEVDGRGDDRAGADAAMLSRLLP